MGVEGGDSLPRLCQVSLWLMHLCACNTLTLCLANAAAACCLQSDRCGFRDGMISKVEMKTYFIRANCHALRNSFKHAFHETTYFRPTFCIHCTGLVRLGANELIMG